MTAAVGLGVSAAAQAGDAAKGVVKAESCFACHGEKGVSELENVPSLAAQPAYFLLQQILLFREKQRNVEPMTEAVKGISDEDADDIAAFFASLPAPPPQSGDAAQKAQGEALIDAHHCASCHLPSFAGREQMPRLAGQRADYLLKALRDFKDNRRFSPDGTMSEVVYPLSDADFAVLAADLAQRP